VTTAVSLEDRADVYAFGLLLWELMHERRAFEGMPSPAAFLGACNWLRSLFVGGRPPCAPRAASVDASCVCRDASAASCMAVQKGVGATGTRAVQQRGGGGTGSCRRGALALGAASISQLGG